MSNILLLMTLLATQGCKDQTPIPDDDIPLEETTTVVWKNVLSKGSTPQFAHLFKDDVIFCLFQSVGEPSPIVALSQETGDTNWILCKSDFILPLSHQFFVEDDYLYVNFQTKVYCINLNDGNIEWELDRPLEYRDMIGLSLTKDQMYITLIKGDKLSGDSAEIHTIDKLSGNLTSKKLVVRSINNNGYSPKLLSPNLYVNLNGDSILIFQNSSYNWTLKKGKMDVIAYDISNDSLYWKVDSLNDLEGGGHHSLLDGDILIVPGYTKLFRINASTGQLIWEQDPLATQTSIISSNFFLIGNRLLVNPGNLQTMNLFSLDDGKLINSEPDSGPSYFDMKQHGTNVYYTDLVYLRCHNSTNTKVQWKLESPLSGAGFRGEIAIDEVSGDIFICDNDNLMRLKLQ